jgi:hypothetical protein
MKTNPLPLRLIALALTLGVQEVHACSIHLLLPDKSVAMADVIIEARIDRFAGQTATVTSLKVHKGSIAGTKLELKGLPRSNTDWRLARLCGIVAPRVGEIYLFQLIRLPGETAWAVIDLPIVLGDPLAIEIVRIITTPTQSRLPQHAL